MKKLILMSLCLTLATALHAPRLEAEEYSTDLGGCGYQECRSCPVLAPAVAIALVTLAAIIAVALQTHNGHGHGH